MQPNKFAHQPTFKYFADGFYMQPENQRMLASSPPLASDSSRPTDAFFALQVGDWLYGIGPTSNPREMFEHPAFRAIVSAGQTAIPFLLRELRREPSLLVVALSEITGENPAQSAAKPTIREVTEACLTWGEKNGF